MTGDFEAILETGGAAAVELAASALIERGGKPGICPNCGASMIGPFCALCGQPRDTHRRSVHGLLHDLFEDIVNFDSRILRTARALLFEPGELPLAFREGRTQRYMPAMRLYFFVTLLFFLILSVSGIAILQLNLGAAQRTVDTDRTGAVFIKEGAKRTILPGFKADKTKQVYIDDDGRHVVVAGLVADGKVHYAIKTQVHVFAPIGAYKANVPPEALKELAEINSAEFVKSNTRPGAFARSLLGGLNKLKTDPAALNGPMTTWIPRILFLLLPLFALLLAAFYWRQRANFYFVDHLVFSLTVHTFMFAVLIVAVGAAQVMPGAAVGWLTLAAIGLYLLLSIRRFYGQSWFMTGLKFVAIATIYLLFVVLPALTGAVVASMVQA